MTSEKLFFFFLVAAVVVGGVIFYLHTASVTAMTEAQVVVIDFGQTLQDVYITLPIDQAAEAIGENYGPYVVPNLLALWEADPQSAPGRTAQDPWPDHIAVTGITDDGIGGYRVTGNIVEVTKADITAGTVAGMDPITATVSKVNGKWMITDWQAD